MNLLYKGKDIQASKVSVLIKYLLFELVEVSRPWLPGCKGFAQGMFGVLTKTCKRNSLFFLMFFVQIKIDLLFA